MNKISRCASNLNLNNIKNNLEKFIRDLGNELRVGFQNDEKEVETKEHDQDFVTKYDKIADKMILDYLQKNYPDIGIITEESDAIKSDSEYSFLVDPIDGTRNFKKGVPIFFTGIALAKNNDTLLSITYNPITDEMYSAIKGEGVYLNGKRIYSSEAQFKDSDISISFRKKPGIQQEITSNIVNEIYGIRNNSCVHHDLAFASRGILDGMVHSGAHIWDYCHYLLLQEAGGIVTDWNGEPFDNTKTDIVAASNPEVHNALLKIVEGQLEKHS